MAEWVGFLFCGKATAVATCHRHVAKSRLSNPTRNRNTPSRWDGVFLWRSGWDSNPRYREVHLISSQGRYNHFDTTPYEIGGICVFAIFLELALELGD